MSRGRSFLSSRFSRSLKSLTSLKSCLEEEVAALEAAPAVARDEPQENGWGNLLPELLGEIIKRVEESEDQWPQRQNVVACACVCKKWRHITKDIVVNSPLLTHSNAGATNNRVKITFPACLKQPGPREFPHQCLIKRNKETSTFYLYMALSSSFTEMGKFLLAARRYRRGAHMEYLISLDADDISQGSNAYVGKLSSDFLGTNFTIYDSQSPHSGAKPSSTRSSRRFASKQISPQVSADNFEVGHVSYKFNLLKSRGPRRMVCAMKYPVSQDLSNCKDVDEPSKVPESATPICSVLRNKTPRWHENLQCWCLNFHGRVTVASVKNFQLVATVDQSQPEGKGDEDTVLLQFGKVAEDTFTMDYRQPLSVFQAFAICLTSFGTKLACE